MAGRSRWFVGSSRTRKLTPSAANPASSARVRSPGDSDDAGRSTASAPSPNLANWARACSGGRPVAAAKESARCAASRRSRRSWASSPTTTLGPMRRVPRASGQPAEQGVDERRLAGPVRPDEGHALGPADVEREGAEGEGPPFDHGVLEAHDDIARPCRLADVEAQVPALPRLVDRPRATRGHARSGAPARPASRSG